MNSCTWTHQCWLTSKNFIHQLCADTECRLKDLPRVMSDRWWMVIESRESVLSACFDNLSYFLTVWAYFLSLLRKLCTNPKIRQYPIYFLQRKETEMDNEQRWGCAFQTCINISTYTSHPRYPVEVISHFYVVDHILTESSAQT